jgi:RNA polymerase sigma factor (sigma-70 family)
MPTPADRLLRCVRLIASQAGSAANDSELLACFLTGRDPAAFAALVARHGPMVLRVCQHVLGNRHDAEDAFQATFLVLARKGASIRPPGYLASWLHGVAYRVALGARTAARRRHREQLASDFAPPDPRPDPLAELTAREGLQILEEEVQRLPEAYRLPVVLCCLHGLSQEEAARQLGWTPGSVKGRLERGRARLRARLVNRGLTLVAALGAAEVARTALASPVPATLAAATVRAALVFTAGTGGARGGIPAGALALAEGGLKNMVVAKRMLSAVLLLAGCVLAGTGALVHQIPAARPPETKQAAEEKQANKGAEGKPRPPLPRTDQFGDPLPDGALARVGTIRLRANDGIGVIAFSPDSRRLAYGSGIGFVYVCEAADGKPVLEFEPDNVHHLGITELAFSPDGRTLAASGYYYEGVWLIDLARRKVRHTLPKPARGKELPPCPQQGPCFAFTPDGRTLVVGGRDGALHLWDTATGTEKVALPGAEGVIHSLTLTADGQTALTAHRGGALHLWDTRNRKHLRKLAIEAVAKYPHLTALAPDGKTVALAVDANKLELWDLDSDRRHRLHTAGQVLGLRFTPDGAALQVADGDGSVLDWDARTGKKRNAWTCKVISVKHTDERLDPRPPVVWFRPDGRALAWADRNLLRSWDLDRSQETPRLSLYRKGITWAGFSADGRVLRAVGEDGEVDVWDAATGQRHGPSRKLDLTWAPKYAPAWDRGRIVIVTAGQNIAEKPQPGEGRILLWDPAGDAGPTPLREQAGPAWYATLTPDNRFVVATEPTGRIRVYDAATGKPIRSFDGRKDEYRLTISPNGALLATRASNWTIRLYDFAKGRVLHELKGLTGISALAFSPDGRWLASGHVSDPHLIRQQPEHRGDTIDIWDTATGRELGRFPTEHLRVEALSFSPDGRLIASCGVKGSVRLWETASGQERRSYPGHRRWVRSVDFAPDGRRLASAGLDGTALIWRVFDPVPAERPAANLDMLWADLARDGTTAHRAMAALLTARGTADFLGMHVKPAIKLSDDQVKRWLTDLGSPKFRARAAAEKEIARVGELIEPALRRAREATDDKEVQRRLTALLDNIARLETRPEQLRALRAVEVLEHLGSTEACHLLGELTKGAAAARLTQEAKASLKRLARRPPVAP